MCAMYGSLVFSSVLANVKRSEMGLYKMPRLFMFGFEMNIMCGMMLELRCIVA